MKPSFPSSSSSSSSSRRKSSIAFYIVPLFLITSLAIFYEEELTYILKQSIPKSQELEISEPQQESVPAQGLKPVSERQQENISAQSLKSVSERQQETISAQGWKPVSEKQQETISAQVSEQGDVLPFAVGRTEEGCDVFKGMWAYDEASTPPYGEDDCPFMEPKLKCQANGRPDNAYQNWRWQPHGCSLPSFNATFMLERLRGKRMLFVGDSLTKGQFVSMLCLLRDSIPRYSRHHKHYRSHSIFAAPEYNATIEFYWAPFLVTSNCDNATFHRVLDRIVHEYSGSLDMHAQHWNGVDILVLNTYAWWQPGKKMKIVRRSQGKKYIRLMNAQDAYRLVLKSMVSWLENSMDPQKTRVFFTTMSATHFRSAEWGGKRDGNCYGETTPILDPTYWGSGSSKGMMEVVTEVLGASKTPISIINITQLSEHRKDAHVSIYRMQPYDLTQSQLGRPESNADCNHWCLPGLQDTWNELLYAKLFFP
ncbi:protein trichome birefringence-like 33 [Phoenix dactylifera]|uniref:Protein trichome birefringence-like 33 n=1 Tax=Phoenix dactylifera TaxID=42345 RepID=A0A8B9A0Y4_PHODC|nr:protein trichome birefringence-like 33 [Phoenix dactylifera]